MTRLSVVVPLAAIALNVSSASAQGLGSASTFAVLGGPAVTCTRSPVTGDVGVALTTAFTNTGCTIVGAIHAGDTAAIAAYADFQTAYNNLAINPPPCTATLTGTLADVTLAPGVYCFEAAAALTGTVTLDGGGNANATWLFRIGTLGVGALTGTGFNVDIVNVTPEQPCNVSWWVRNGATLTDSNFLGTILAGADSTVTGGTVSGHALSNGAVTLTDTSVTVCAPGPVVPPPDMDKCDDHRDDDGDDDDDDGDHHDNDGDHHDKDGDHHNRDGDYHADDGDRHDGDRRDKDCDKDHKDKKDKKDHKDHKDHKRGDNDSKGKKHR